MPIMEKQELIIKDYILPSSLEDFYEEESDEELELPDSYLSITKYDDGEYSVKIR